MEKLNLPHETRRYVLTGITRILGSQPANPDVRSAYIATKAATLQKGDEETGRLPAYTKEELEGMNLSVFLRDDGRPCLCDYVVKGFLKEALGVIKGYEGVGIAAPATKVDNLIIVTPAYLTFSRGSLPIAAPDDTLERPLRAMTMQGPRTTVTASELINPGWQINFDLTLLDNAKTAKSAKLSFDIIERALDYGMVKGLGQWRNAQNGRFTWARIA